ncbi:IS66 family transposase [Neolewinella litorea]|uniref:IS66 family transposase n=1 Tax=Neolewinella litorea TaxID=2562452 RepID=UPI0014560108|nr:IS66 family transposase [Neolewinella litorea]
MWGQSAPLPEPAKQEVTYTRHKPKKAHPGRASLPEHLPVEEIVLEPQGVDTAGLECIGQEVTDTLDYRPGKLVIIRRIRPKYARPEADGSTTVLVADLPSRSIDKGIPEPGLLAELCVAKYVDHLPFYRQIKRFERDHGWVVHKATVGDWFAATCSLLEPLYQQLLRTVVDSDYLQVDESTIKVLASEKKGKAHLGYQWVYRDPDSGLVLFDYRKGRGVHGVMERLADFAGYLQTDGYKAYETYLRKHPQVTGVSCLAHIRRKFFEAREQHPRLAELALAAIGFLYHVEAHCRKRGRSAAERLALRRRVSRPVYEALLDWAEYEQKNNLSSGAIGKALKYARDQLPRLSPCFRDGRLEVDNNLIENSIRPLALGRKNYLFAGSHEGARRAAMLYSFFASCQRLEVNPRAWLRDILERIPDHPVNRLDELLPHRWAEAPAEVSTQ